MQFQRNSFTHEASGDTAAQLQFVVSDLPPKFVVHHGDLTHFTIGYDAEKTGRIHQMRTLRKAIRSARDYRLRNLLVNVSHLAVEFSGIALRDLGRLVAENFVLANYQDTRYKTSVPYAGIETITFDNADDGFYSGVEVGLIAATAANICRDLSNTPSCDQSPAQLLQWVKDHFLKDPVEINAIVGDDLLHEGLRLIHAVGRGSSNAPHFIILKYFGGNPDEAPEVIIGKTVVFDTGGYDIKSAEGMDGMHRDMTGGAAAIAALDSAVRMKLKKNIIVLLPVVDNAVSGNAFRPNDIIKSASGFTVEIGNTDAEGRLILVDAIWYAKRFNPSVVLCLATLTGAAAMATTELYSAVFCHDEQLLPLLIEFGVESGCRLLPLPFDDDFDAMLKSDYADIRNIRTGGKEGGASTAAQFLWWAAKDLDCPFAHIDIAGPMKAGNLDHLAPGNPGTPVLLLSRFLERY